MKNYKPFLKTRKLVSLISLLRVCLYVSEKILMRQLLKARQYLYIIRYLLLKYRLIFLRVLEVFDEPLGESNTERQVKISACISKEGT